MIAFFLVIKTVNDFFLPICDMIASPLIVCLLYFIVSIIMNFFMRESGGFGTC